MRSLNSRLMILLIDVLTADSRELKTDFFMRILLFCGALCGAVFMFQACQNAEVERLTEEKEESDRLLAELVEEHEELKAEHEALLDETEALQQLNDRIDFLAEQLSGVTATIETNHGEMELEFYPEKAPIHVFNFVSRAESGYYDGLKFHRIIENFMIQAGDPKTKGDDRSEYGGGGPIANIPHEFNDISHQPGILSMARVSDVEEGAGSQFFIMHGEATRLDGEYTAFGNLISGTETLESIATTETYGEDSDYQDQPKEHVVIEQITVSK